MIVEMIAIIIILVMIILINVVIIIIYESNFHKLLHQAADKFQPGNVSVKRCAI